MSSLMTFANDSYFGKITITPFIPDEVGLNDKAKKLLLTKLEQICTTNNVAGGFDRRFVITTKINVLKEAETATIPQKTSIRASISFFVGDGVSSTLFGNYSIELNGVGDSHDEALFSVIRKINVGDKDLMSLINGSKDKIIKYYDSYADVLISEAKNLMASNKYEDALGKISVIPATCKLYNKVQPIIQECGKKIIERDNNSYLIKARAAWSSNPTQEGAVDARKYIEKIIISSTGIKKEVEKLNKDMSKRLVGIDNKEREMEKVRLLSEERLQTEQIRASERTVSTFIGILPKLAYNILCWF